MRAPTPFAAAAGPLILSRQVEAMAQLGGLICLQEPCSDGKGTFFFAGVDGVRACSGIWKASGEVVKS